MDLPPPVFDDIEGAKEWCDRMYRWLTFPGNLHPQYLELQELEEIATPDDGRGRIYLADAGGGLSQFLIVFPSGNPIRMALEAGTGAIDSTDDVTEGSTNLYFTDARTVTAVNSNWPYLVEATADGYLTLGVSTANVTTPIPTDAELDTEFGTPVTVGAGFMAFLDANGAGTNFYLIVSDGTNWWHSVMTTGFLKAL